MTYKHIDNWQKYAELNRLHDLKKPPVSLWAAGEWNPEIFSQCVTVVGSRQMTNYGRQVIEKLVP